MPRRRNRREKGIALIVLGLSLVFTTLIVGLAIDCGTILVIRGRVGAAVDAAALAAGRSLNLGATPAEADAAATTAATNFFRANFPNGFFGTNQAQTVLLPTFTQQMTGGVPNGIIDIAVEATVRAPVYFMRVLNVLPPGGNLDSISIFARGTATRRGLAMMLVLDVSGSMGSGAGSACEVMKAAAQEFITNFGPYDVIGLNTFNDSARLPYAPSSNWASGGALRSVIGGLNCGGTTNTTGALNWAYDQLINVIRRPLALNTIVLFTDGNPNSINAVFPAKRALDDRLGGPSLTSGGGTVTCTNTNAICVNMDFKCTAGGTMTGSLSQSTSFRATGTTSGLSKSRNTDANVTYPSNCPTGNSIRGAIAYIPDVDRYGNATTGFFENWLFDTNVQPHQTRSDPRTLGAIWAAGVAPLSPRFNTTSNRFTSGPYQGFYRPDQPNTVMVTGLNAALSQASTIRNDTTYNVVINTIFLIQPGTGNASTSDPVTKDFLPRVANSRKITPIPWDPIGTLPIDNPDFNPAQQEGMALMGEDPNSLYTLFSQVASSLLRLSR